MSGQITSSIRRHPITSFLLGYAAVIACAAAVFASHAGSYSMQQGHGGPISLLGYAALVLAVPAFVAEQRKARRQDGVQLGGR